MDANERVLALGRLNDPAITPIQNLVGIVLSAYSENGEFDSEYVLKYKDVYCAFLETANYQTVFSRISKEGCEWCPGSKVTVLKQKLQEVGFIGIEVDLASLFSTMSFPPHAQPKLPDEPDEKDEEIPADAKYEIMQNVRLVMTAYKALYGTVFEALRPKGAYSINPKYGAAHGVILHNTAAQLTSAEIAAGKKGNDSQVSPSDIAMNRISTLYETIFDGSTLIDVAASDVNYEELGARNGYYFPARAGRFASGTLKSNGIRFKNGTEFEKEQNKWVYARLQKVYDVYKNKGEQACLDALSIAAQNLATAIVVAEFDASVSNLLVLKICAPSIPDIMLSGGSNAVGLLQAACKTRNLKNVRVRSVSCNVDISKNTNDFPVYTVVVALNDELEKNAPMFAYQVWDSIKESGGSIESVIGTHNIIFGRKPDGSLKTINMAKLGGDVNHNITVVAGSGSGKGLTTLATVAAAAAHKQPLFYLDCKPEMSATLWQYMEQAGQPGRVFSYDTFLLGMQGTSKWRNPVPGSDAGRYNHYEFPFDFSENYDPDELFGGLILVKVLTLMLALMNFSQKNGNEKERWEYLDYDWQNGLLFVLDELEKNENERLSVLKALCSSKLNGETEGSGKNASITPRGAYVAKLAKMYNGMMRPLGNADKAILRMSPVSTLSLFQTTKHITGGKSAFEKIFGTATLMGRIDIGGASPIVKDLSNDVADPIKGNNRQWFHIPQSIKMLSGDMLSTPLKPFLVFNTPEDADQYLQYDTTYNTIDDSDYKRKVEVENRHKLDFVGMLKAYGVDLAYSLSKGFDIAQRFLHLAGFEGTVDDYILSAADETLISYAELNKRAADNIQKWKRGEDFTTNSAVQTSAGDADWDSEDTFEQLNTQINTSTEEVKNEEASFNMFDTGSPDTSNDFGFNDATDYENENVEKINTSFSRSDDIPLSDTPLLQQSKQQTTKQPIFYINGMPFIQDKEGNFHYATGRFAPPQNVPEGVFNGQRYTAHPIVDSASASFSYEQNGAVQVIDPRLAPYAQNLDGAEVSFKGSLKPITPHMSVTKLNKALAQRWYILMQAGAKQVGNAGLVTHVSVGENSFVVNGTPVYATESIIGDTGVRITHLVNFAELFKYYKNLKQLDLDYPARIAFGVSYSSPALPFTQSKLLQVIKFTDSTGKIIAFTREHAAQKLNIPEDRLNARFNTWSEFSAKVNKGSSSALCKPGHKLVMADFTKRMAVGTFGPGTTWSKPRRAFGFIGMLLGSAGTIVTGGVQAARAATTERK